MNWLLCETLAFLEAPTVAKKGISLLQKATTQEEQMEYAGLFVISKLDGPTNFAPSTSTGFSKRPIIGEVPALPNLLSLSAMMQWPV